MFAAVYGMVVVVAVISFSHRGVTASIEGIYTHTNHHLFRNQEKAGFTIMQVSKKEVAPYFRSAQYSCLRNGSHACPSWSYCDSTDGKCKCPQIPTRALDCDGFEKENGLRVLDCNCVTYNEEQNLTEVGFCIYNCGNYKKNALIDVVYHFLPPNITDWNDVMCGKFNRTGTLCGKCNEEDGFYPRAYSFDMTCIQCTNGKYSWWKYVLSAYLPLTLFYLVILCFKISIQSSQLHGYIIYSQVISCPAFSRAAYLITQSRPIVFQMVKFLGTVYGIWNLDFFRMYNTEICLQTNSLATLALDYAVALYPLLLIAITYMMISLYDSNFKPIVILWNPFRAFNSHFQRNLDFRTSTVDAFATFFFLSNMKFLTVSLDFLIPVRVYHFTTPQHHVSYTWRLYYDATVPYFGAAHLPYAILTIVLLFLVAFIPTLIITMNHVKLCHKYLNILPRRGQLFLHIFMDAFLSCYKDGTEPGTRDCRCFSLVLFMARFIFTSMYMYLLNSLYFPYAAVVFIITAMITIVADPYKDNSLNSSIFFMFIAAFYVCMAGIDMVELRNHLVIIYVLYPLTLLMAVVPFLYISFLTLHWIFSHRKLGMSFIGGVKAWRQGYKELM